WASPDLGGSAFGRAVRRALAGACDRPFLRSDGKTKAGNRNGRVSLAELHAYVAAEVGRWSRRNRAADQTPQLLSRAATSFDDFRLAWSMDHGHLDKYLEADAVSGRVADNVKPEERQDLWNRFETVRGARPYQTNPLAWRDWEHRLLWLDQ